MDTGDRRDHTIAGLLGNGADQDTAITAPGRSPLTHGELRRVVSDLSRLLRAEGVRRQDRVAIVLRNGPEAATAFLGVASAAVAAPLNPGSKSAELERDLVDLGARALVVEAGMDSPARETAARLGLATLDLAPAAGKAGAFVIEKVPAAQTGAPGADTPASPDDFALLLQTSGTTSRPKIVPLSHANLCASARHIRDTLALTPRDRCLNILPLFHIHGLVGALLSSMASGGSVACAPGFDAFRFFNWMRETQPSWYTAVPSMHQAILAMRARAAARGRAIETAGLRFVRSSSAALAPSVMADLEAAFEAPVIESYGMTEAAHQIASNPLPPGRRRPGSVGLAAGPTVAILDRNGNNLAPGETGEIAIRGPNVTQGYEGNPQANQQSFDAGWFRTGDLGTKDAAGYLTITGRLKEQINRGGEKISPREIDEVLLQHPDVAEAVAFAVPEPRLGEEVAAAIVLQPEADLEPDDLRRFARERLTNSKVPRTILVLAELPKGPTGKLQRIGLAERLGLVGRSPRNELDSDAKID